MSSKKKVILDHDGGVDDIVALAILAAAHETIELIGTVCIDADCLIDHATRVAGKVLSGMQAHGRRRFGSAEANPFEYLGSVKTARSTLKAVHPFPLEWRTLAVKMNDLPCMNTALVKDQWLQNGKHEIYNQKENDDENSAQEFKAGEEFLAELVFTQGSPTDKITICVTGPLSNIAYCIQKYKSRFTDNIERIVIMGGAVDVIGNVNINSLTEPKKTAEWNIYWDAPSAKIALETMPDGIQNVLFALDATNDVPIMSEFVQRFGLQKEGSFLSEFIGSAYAMCTHFSYVCPGHTYFAWDGLTAAWLVRPSIVDSTEKVPLKVTLAEEDSTEEGRTKRLTEIDAAKLGIQSSCLVPRGVHAEEFYDMVLELTARI